MKFISGRPIVIFAAAWMMTILSGSLVRAELKPTTPAKSRASLPPEVRSMMPDGATSLHFGRLLPGPQDEPRLVHVWVMGRKTESQHDRDQWQPSPFCVDLFEAGSKPGTWSFTTSTVYLGKNKPTEVEARWLQPGQKQGPVIILITPAYMHTLYTVLTFPNVGTDQWDKFGAVQEFSQGGVGGGKILHDFGVDERGYMTVVTESSYNGQTQSKTVRAWNGSQYVAATPNP